MLTIRAISLNGQPLTQPLQADFDELGGSIGRADDNVLVLPDPERHISRTQATITYGEAGYVIRDCGSAVPVVLNGRPLGKGAEAGLAAGDKLQIGGYALEALDGAARPAPQDPAGAPRDDPLAMFGRSDADPFGLGLPGSAPSGPASPRIPDDFDLGPGSAPNIDQLFGLGQTPAVDPLGAASPLSVPGEAGTEPMSLDPLVALGGRAPTLAPPPQRDDALEIRSPYIPPSASFGGAAASVDSGNMPYSWNATPAEAAAHGAMKTVTVPQSGAVAGEAQAAPEAASAELLRAFLAGAGVPDLDLQGPLTPQTMNEVGQLLRAATEGLLDLLRARALIKRELQANVTIIVPRENNPLKFSPNADVALAHLLAPGTPGFMGSVAAVKDACDDLRAHQFGVVAGMRAALEGVLRRFDPVQLERRLTEQNMLDSLLPMRREARLWTQFGELYGDLTREAQDDFDSLFGQEFVRAYEAQLDQIKRRRAAKR